jgi:hypothetical protein
VVAISQFVLTMVSALQIRYTYLNLTYLVPSNRKAVLFPLAGYSIVTVLDTISGSVTPHLPDVLIA